MNIKQFELIILKSGDLILVLNFLVVFQFLWISVKKLNIIKILLLANGLLALFDTLILRYFLSDSFKYKKELLTLFASLGIENAHWISSISYLIKFILLSFFFSSIFKNKKVSKFYIYLIFALILFELIRIFYFKSFQSYDSISSTVKNIFIISGSGLLLYRIYKADISNISLYKNTYFWIAFALFITAITELFIEFIFTKLHESDLAGFYKLYLVRNAFQVMFFLLMIVGFLNAKYLRFLPDKY